MREIEFRGKRKDNGEWVYGGYTKVKDRDYAIIFEEHEEGGGFGSLAKKETVGQYTGIKDKNGKKIFEGDIVKPFLSFDCLYVVKHFKCGLICERIDNPLVTIELYGVIHDDAEVIGNIHDNPELLKEENNA